MSGLERIGVNVMAGMARMVIGVLVGLVSSRLLLSHLGDGGFGTLTALGASGAFLLFFTAAINRGLQRELAYCMGKKDSESARRVFTAVSSIFCCLGLLFVIVMMLARGWVLGIMNFPQESWAIVEWVYVFAVAQIAIGIAAAPFRASLEATQNLAHLSGLETCTAVLNLGLIATLPFWGIDKLLAASGAQVALACISAAGAVALSKWRCGDIITYTAGWRIQDMRGVMKITSWSLFGHLNWIVRNEGSVFALNVFFGPAVNASYSLALRLHALQNELAFVATRAIQPAVTSSVAADDHERARLLTLLGSKLPVIASLLVWLPILFCAEEIFQLWLGRVPEHAGMFVRVLGVGMLGLASFGHQMALEARGRLAGVTLWMTLPPVILFGIWCALRNVLSLPVWSLPGSQAILGLFLVFIVRPIFYGSVIGVSPRDWFRGALWPAGVTHLVGAAASLPVWLFLPTGVIRLGLLSLISTVSMVGAVLVWGLRDEEKSELRRLGSKFSKYFGRQAPTKK